MCRAIERLVWGSSCGVGLSHAFLCCFHDLKQGNQTWLIWNKSVCLLLGKFWKMCFPHHCLRWMSYGSFLIAFINIVREGFFVGLVVALRIATRISLVMTKVVGTPCIYMYESWACSHYSSVPSWCVLIVIISSIFVFRGRQEPTLNSLELQRPRTVRHS